MTTRLPNPFLVSAAGPAGRQTAAASVSSPGRAAAVTNPAPEVMALTAPGMARTGISELCTPGWSADPQINRALSVEAGLRGHRAQDGSIRGDQTSERFLGTTAEGRVCSLDRSLLVTAGRDRQPIPIPEPANGAEPEAGEAMTASARAASSPALRAPADPDAVEGGCGHAPALSTAVRAFGPGNVLAKFETDLASIVADINAHERFMRGLPAFIAAPSAAYLTAISRNP